MTTVAPLWAWVGENDEIVGRPGFVTVKFCVLVAVPSEFVTAILPVVAYSAWSADLISGECQRSRICSVSATMQTSEIAAASAASRTRSM